MSDINYEDYRDLLIVSAEGRLHVVEAPAHEAEISNLVAFDVAGKEMLGPVIDKMWCNRTESEYRCFGRMTTIFKAKIIYRKKWPTSYEESVNS